MSSIKTVINDSFWNNYRQLVREEMIPYQWNVLNDKLDINIEKERNDNSIPSDKSHAIENFKIAAGRTTGEHYGWVFQDSDLYKWLEAVAYSLATKEDSELKSLADSVVDLIGEAQEEDGYLNTYFTIKEPERKYKCLRESHELYSAGHFIEAAVAYHCATKNEKVLNIACKLANHLYDIFGEAENKVKGYDGHQEIEIALLKLYEVTLEEKYLNLSSFFLYERGKSPNFFEKQDLIDKGKQPLIAGMDRFPLSYYQAHMPVTEQESAEGHAVRLVYMCTAMADVAYYKKNNQLLQACKKLWNSIVNKRMYITGGIGSTVFGEAFTFDYDLPNDTMYCETCASIGLIFFAFSLLKNEKQAEFGNVLERALYNTVLGGMSLDGKHFFYVNPLEVVPESSAKDPHKSHVKASRPEWFGCACCPPNLARLLLSIEKYIYLQENQTIFINLFIGSESQFHFSDGDISLQQKTNYPWDGKVEVSVGSSCEQVKTLAIRLPDWAKEPVIHLNDKEFRETEVKDGYLYITRKWAREDCIVFEFEMTIQKRFGNPKIRSTNRKVAIQRGPLIFCVEGIDNGEDLHLYRITKDTKFEYTFKEDLFNGVGVIRAEDCSFEVLKEDIPVALYYDHVPTELKQRDLTLIPYYCWANREVAEMSVWLNYQQ